MNRPLCAVGALITLTVMGCTTPAQLFRDAHLDKLCAIDGGLHVYHKQPSHLRNAVAELLKPPKNSDLFATRQSFSPIEGSPSDINYMWRTTTELYRVSDGVLLAEYVMYTRRGWDALRPHHSHYSCPSIRGADSMMLNAVFEEGAK